MYKSRFVRVRPWQTLVETYGLFRSPFGELCVKFPDNSHLPCSNRLRDGMTGVVVSCSDTTRLLRMSDGDYLLVSMYALAPISV